MAFTPNNKQAKRYQPQSNELSGFGLKAGTWYVRNRAILAKIGTIVLMVVAASLALYSLVWWSIYLFAGAPQDRETLSSRVASFTDYDAIKERYAASPLRVQNVEVFGIGGDRYDAVATVTNPNTRWVAHLTYYVTHADGETSMRETVLLPGQQKPVAVLGFTADRFPRNVSFVRDDVVWERVDEHVVPNVDRFLTTRANFPVGEVTFIQAGAVEGLQTAQVLFELTNNTAYSYWEADFIVELMNGNQTVGVLPLIEEQFRAGETRSVDLRLLDESIRVTGVEVHLGTNIFDNGVYMLPGQ